MGVGDDIGMCPHGFLAAHHCFGDPVLLLAHKHVSLSILLLHAPSNHVLDVRMRLMAKEDKEARCATVAMEEEEVEHAIAVKAKEVIGAGSSTIV